MAFVFENRETVLFLVQEAVHADRSALPAEVAERTLARLSNWLPEARALTATLLIEPKDPSRWLEELEALQGLTRGHIFLELARGVRVAALFPSGSADAETTPPALPVRFLLNREQAAAFRDPALPAHLVISHPSYGVRTELPRELRATLAGELEES